MAIKLFGVGFHIVGIDPSNENMFGYTGIEQALDLYTEFCADCLKWNLPPGEYFVYKGTHPDEKRLMDEPDLIMRFDPETSEIILSFQLKKL